MKLGEKLKAVERKHWWLLAIVAIIVLAPLVDQDSPKPNVRRPVEERLFLATVHDKYPLAPDADAVAAGHRVCLSLDRGVTFQDLGVAVISQANDASTVAFSGYVAGAAISALCPEYSYQIPR